MMPSLGLIAIAIIAAVFLFRRLPANSSTRDKVIFGGLCVIVCVAYFGFSSSPARKVEKPAPPVVETKTVAPQPTAEELEIERLAEEKRAAEIERNRRETAESKQRLENYLAKQAANRLTIDEFNARLLENLDVDSMGTPSEIRSDAIIYPLDNRGDVYFSELITTDNNLRGLSVVIKDVRQDTLFAAWIFYEAAVKSFSPAADTNAILSAIGLNETVVENLSKPQSVTVKGITYYKKFSGQSLVLGIKE